MPATAVQAVRLIRGAAVVLAVVPFVVHAWVALHGYFGQDDFVITYRAAHANPLDPGYLFQDYSGHLAPGTFLTAWLLTAVAPLNYPVAVAPLLVLHAVALWLWWRVLERCFGVRWAILPAFAVLCASPLILFPTLWWAYGMQLLPLLVAMAAALLAHLHGAYVQSLLWTVGGFLFYEKAALIAAVLFGVTVLRGERMATVLVRYRWVWLAHVVLLVGYAALYFGLTADQASGGPVPAENLGEFSYRSIVDTLLPGLIGGPLTAPAGGATWTTPPLAMRVLAMVVTAALVAVTARRAPAAWLLLAAYLVVDLALVAVTRLAVVGPAIATDPRYLADAVPVAVLCTTFACLARAPNARARKLSDPPGNVETGGPPGERMVHSHGIHPKVALARPQPSVQLDTLEIGGPSSVRMAHSYAVHSKVLVAGVCVLLLAGGIVSFLRVAPALQFRDARAYVATAREAFAARPGIVLYDTLVPASILLPWFVEDAQSSRVVGLLPGAPRFDQPAETLYRLDETGAPRPVDNLADAVKAEPGPAPDCGHFVDEDPVKIPLTTPVFGRRVIKIGYYTADTGAGTVTVDGDRVPVRFRTGLHVLYVVVTGSFTHVEIARNLNLAPLCVTDLTVGVPR